MNVPETYSLAGLILGRGNRRGLRQSAKRHAVPRPGRDNSVSPSRHNLFTMSFYGPIGAGAEPEYVNKTK
jgi:hypothetical protein